MSPVLGGRIFFFFFDVFTYFWLSCLVVLVAVLSLAVVSGGYSPAAVRGPPIAAASPVAGARALQQVMPRPQ